MFQINDTVLYGAQGVCRITEITRRAVDGRQIDYYVLKPLFNKGGTLLVPMGNAALLSRMRPVLSREELHGLIGALAQKTSPWIENENERKEKYRQALTSADRLDLLCLLRALYEHRQTLLGLGKKVHAIDERFCKDAEKIVCDEFSYVLDIERDQVTPYIQTCLAGN